MIIDKMLSLKNLTSQEKEVVKHIINNPKDLLEMNVSELAQASYTSASTIIRLCKKIEVKGYGDLKCIYASEFSGMMKQRQLLRKEPFDPHTSIDDIINTLPHIYAKAIDHTKSLLSRNTIIRVTNLMKQAQRVEIYGSGVNYDLAKMMAYRFESVYKDCFVYNAAHLEHIQYLELQKIPTLAILLSHTGQNPMVIDAAKRLKNSGMKTVSISGHLDSQLVKLTDEHIHIMETNNELELKTIAFTMAIQYILDICISALLIHSIDKVEKVGLNLANYREK